jgi:hypothetical protein
MQSITVVMPNGMPTKAVLDIVTDVVKDTKLSMNEIQNHVQQKIYAACAPVYDEVGPVKGSFGKAEPVKNPKTSKGMMGVTCQGMSNLLGIELHLACCPDCRNEDLPGHTPLFYALPQPVTNAAAEELPIGRGYFCCDHRRLPVQIMNAGGWEKYRAAAVKAFSARQVNK